MIIKNNKILKDDWSLLRLLDHDTPSDIVIPLGKVIVPFSVWMAQKDILQNRIDLGVWLSNVERAESLQNDVHKFPIIAIDFPKFSDGRGYSIAYHLRTRLGFRGELRAIGDVLRDQIFYMSRVGFDSFAIRADKDIQNALNGLNDFSETYQASSDQALPLFRRSIRGGVF